MRSPVQQTRGLNRDCDRKLKRIFKGSAMTVIRSKMEPLWTDNVPLVENGTRLHLARLFLWMSPLSGEASPFSAT